MKSSQKGFAALFLVLGVTILILGGGYYIYSQNEVQLSGNSDSVASTTEAKIESEIKSENIGQTVVAECSQSADVELCLSGKAILLKDSGVCSLIPSAKEYCLSSYGINFNDVKACDLLTDNPNTQTKEICYQEVAKKLNNYKVCDKLDVNGWHYRQCYGDAAYTSKDEELCEQTGEYRENCIKAIENGVRWTDYRNGADSSVTANLNTLGKCGLTITSVFSNAKVSFPLTITGNIDNSNNQSLGCAWGSFEGVGGNAQLYFNHKNQGWKTLGNSALIVVPNWTSVKSSFSTTLDFDNDGIGLPGGTALKVVFSDDNATGLPPDTFELPLVLK